MIKKSQREFLLPIPKQDIKIVGMHIETSSQPSFLISSDKILLSDEWFINLVYNSYGSSVPEALQFQVSWEDEIPWENEMSSQISITYNKKPFNVLSTIKEDDQQPFLSIILEVLLQIDLQYAAQCDNDGAKPQQSAAIVSNNKIIAIETQIEAFSKALASFEEKLQSLEEHFGSLSLSSSLKGNVLDNFRLIPIGNAIIELYETKKGELVYKTSSDRFGRFYFDQVNPGVYDLQVKHPRFKTLSIKQYQIVASEKKNQDFLLYRS